jgi:hypothetical protein
MKFVGMEDEPGDALWASVTDPEWPDHASGTGTASKPAAKVEIAWFGRAEFLVEDFIYGWPRHSLKWRYVLTPFDEQFYGVLPPKPGTKLFHRPMSSNAGMDGMRFALPLWPVWPGFLINSIFLAIVIWFASLFSPLGMVRRLRGRCPQCGYDLRAAGAAGCSECGWARRRRKLKAES